MTAEHTTGTIQMSGKRVFPAKAPDFAFFVVVVVVVVTVVGAGVGSGVGSGVGAGVGSGVGAQSVYQTLNVLGTPGSGSPILVWIPPVT
mmetsp:Transcript_5437/g.14722  ORF Transcript_5437/g.14722 Transcript_5437/m.14722 type:complete len:89 (-) Transcript_5437:656-922(-)